MNYADLVIQHYTRTYQVITRLTDDMTHAESLQQWNIEANCINWLFGHLTVARLNILAMLGETTPIWDMSRVRLYIPGSQSISAASETVENFADIGAAFHQTQSLLVSIVKSLDDADWLAEQETGTTFSLILYYAQHEAFHAGQIELARAMLRKTSVMSFE